MKTIDFTQPGGFPLTQDRLGYMQTSYKECLESLGGIVSDGTVPVAVSGMVSTSGGLSTTTSDGWLYYNGELIRFIGVTMADSPYPIEPFIVVSETTTSLTYNNGSSHNAVKEKTATFQLMDVTTTATDATHVPAVNLIRFGKALGLKSRDSAFVTQSLATAAGSGSVTGSVSYKKDSMSNCLIYFGSFTVNSPGDFTATLPVMTAKRLCTIVGNYRPVSSKIYFRANVADGNNMLIDANGGYHTSLSAYIQTNGELRVDFPDTDASITTYTLSFSGVASLD